MKLPGKLPVALLVALIWPTYGSAGMGTKMANTSDVVSVLQAQLSQASGAFGRGVDTLELALSDMPFDGIAIAAPSRVEAHQLGELPVILASQQTVLRGWEVPEQDNLHIAVADLNTGRVSMKRVLEDAKDLEHGAGVSQGRPPKPSPAAGAAIETKVRKLDLAALFRLPRRSGSLTVTAFCFERVSNSVRVELLGSDSPVRDVHRISPWPAEGRVQGETMMPSYNGRGEVPQGGLDFQVQSRPAVGGSLVFAGAFAKALAEDQLLPLPEVVKDNEVSQRVVAVIPITLVVLALDSRAPRLRLVGVPVYAANLTSGRSSARGYFAVDFVDGDEPPLPRGRVAAYVLMEGQVYGPQLAELP